MQGLLQAFTVNKGSASHSEEGKVLQRFALIRSIHQIIVVAAAKQHRYTNTQESPAQTHPDTTNVISIGR